MLRGGAGFDSLELMAGEQLLNELILIAKVVGDHECSLVSGSDDDLRAVCHQLTRAERIQCVAPCLGEESGRVA